MASLNDLKGRNPVNGTPGNAIATPKRTLPEILTLPKDKQFPAMLDVFSREIALALPAHLNAERMGRLALTAFKSNSALARCNPFSVFQGVILASQLGLEIGVDGQCYLIPYGDTATFVPGWKGYVELINRAGRASVWTGAVYKGDEFSYSLGDSPHVTHRPMGASEETPANLTHVYAVGRVKGSEWPVIEVWPLAKILRHRDKHNKVGKKHYSYKDLEMYARKIPLLQVMKYMPKSVELRTAMALEENPNAKFDLKDVIDGEWSHVAAEAELTQGDEPAQQGENDAGEPEPGGGEPATTNAEATVTNPPGDANKAKKNRVLD